jgi:hypothetical protein
MAFHGIIDELQYHLAITAVGGIGFQYLAIVTRIATLQLVLSGSPTQRLARTFSTKTKWYQGWF